MLMNRKRVVITVIRMAMSKIALSSYADALDICNKQRYLEKINSINIDSYTLPSHELKRDVLPPVQCTVIFNYLVLDTSSCSTERFKAFKGMDAYKYFECGFVLSVAAKKIDKKLCSLYAAC